MSDDGPVDEWLDTPDPPRWPLVLAALFAVGVLVVVLIHATNTTKPAPAAAPSPPAVAAPAPAPLDTLGPTNCPESDDGQNACATNDRLPAEFLRAVDALFPGVRTETARTDVIRPSAYSPPDPLWYRLFTARSDDLELLIQIRQVRPGDRSMLSTSDSTYATTSRILLTRADHWAVLISVVSIGVPAPTAQQLRALAADDRLLSI